MKANLGPVAPMMFRGCPERAAKAMPPKAVDSMASTTPISAFVRSWYELPKARAGERQAKNRKQMEDTVF
jgi:hypothetical protein